MDPPGHAERPRYIHARALDILGTGVLVSAPGDSLSFRPLSNPASCAVRFSGVTVEAMSLGDAAGISIELPLAGSVMPRARWARFGFGCSHDDQIEASQD
jgi:hypothetical protein